MAKHDEAILERVAGAISDGTPVDWERELEASRGLRPKARGLRLVEAVVRAHRETSGGLPAGIAEAEETHDMPMQAGPTPRVGGDEPQRSAWGPLRILDSLGKGSYGEVYRAFDPALQREVALKLRRPDRHQGEKAEARFVAEARRLASVRHPNIVVVHGADRHEGRTGLWTDLVHGKTLEAVLAEQGPFGEHEAATIGIAVCGALAAVHRAGLVHRDVKTANIMREQGGRIVLMDFGSVIEGAAATGDARGEKTISGTPLYMAPEILLAGNQGAPASDIYSLGVVLFRLVTGRFPIETNSLNELVAAHRDGTRLRLRDLRPELSPAFVQVVECALEPDTGRRYASAGEMEQALARCSGTGVAAEKPAEHAVGWSRRRATFLLAGTLSLLAVIVAGIWLAHPWSGPLAVEAALYREGQGTEERLLPGGRVQPGDHLFLEVRSAEPIYVYVLNEDEVGNSFVLFPAGLDLSNPLPGSARHRLPGSSPEGRQMTWEVTSPGQKENFLVIASRTPLEVIERDLAKVPRAAEGREVTFTQVSPEALAQLRGVGGMSPALAGGASQGAGTLELLSQRLAVEAAGEQGLWTWHIQLENPE